jgi:hypothetical protein
VRYIQPWLDRGTLVALRSVPPLPALDYCFIRRKDDTRALVKAMKQFATQVVDFSAWAEPGSAVPRGQD